MKRLTVVVTDGGDHVVGRVAVGARAADFERHHAVQAPGESPGVVQVRVDQGRQAQQEAWGGGKQ
jgi:hypothetical protein